MAKRVGELLVDVLIRAGVQRVYGIAGDSLNGITDAIRARREIEWVSMRHEEAAAFAAGAEAHLTGRLAVCAGSCGPGNVHLINGLYDCHRSRVPVLAIAAQIPTAELGSRYFQETHPERLFVECSHYCEAITHASQMPRSLEIAIQTAIGLRGVSVIAMPGDIALGDAQHQEPRMVFSHQRPTVTPGDEDVQRLANVLNHGARVTILAGAGSEGAHDELVELAGKVKAPVVHALRGKEFVEYDNPYDVGLTGLIGFASGYHAMMNADTLLMLGTDFPYPQFYPTQAQVAQVDIRPEQIGRRSKVDVPVVGEVKATLRAVLPRLDQKSGDEHLRASLDHYRRSREDLDRLAVGVAGKKPIHPQFLAKTIDEVAAADAIFTCDVGTPTIWAARYLRMNGRRRLIGSFNHGSMANALPQAIGAQAAHPNRQVVTMSGDGGVAMLLGDLLSLPQHKLPVKIVVFNNSSYGFVALEMKAAGFLTYGTDLINPNFAKMAEGAGVFGIRAESPEEVRPALEKAFQYAGPAVVDVVVNRQELSMPPTITMNQAIGFNLYLLKAVMNGQGDEIIDLARTNLFR